MESGTAAPHFLARVYCGQMAGWIGIPLGMEIGLGSGDIVLVGDPAPPTKRGTAAPHFLADVYCGQMVAHLGNSTAELLSKFTSGYAGYPTQNLCG